MLGWIIVASIVALVAYYSPYKPWMPIVGMVVGTAFALVFLLGGRQ